MEKSSATHHRNSSSTKCKHHYESSSSISSKSTITSRLFDWNRELPRYNSEYVTKKYSKPFNNVADELNIIGGLGPIRCISKKQRHGKLVNRPTQVEKISHTTTKLLPNFNFTEQLKPIACETKQYMSIREHVEDIRIAENLPISNETSGRHECHDKIKSFNHENPFNLDLNALSEYQKQKSAAEQLKRRRNCQIIRRTMETKKLKTEGVERIKQEERDAKFKLPVFFKISHDDEQDEDEMMKTADPENDEIKSAAKYKCQPISMLNKPKNKEIVDLHLKHKEDNLRRRIRVEKEKEEAMSKEMALKAREEKENEIFQLAYENFPPSECIMSRDAIENNKNVAESSNDFSIKFDYAANGVETNGNSNSSQPRLVENSMNANENRIDTQNGIPCGRRIGKCVILRGFHDRLYTEPRGKSNLHRRDMKTNDCCRTHKEWLQTISNDPKIVNPPPKGKTLSSIKAACDPNDEKMFLFDDNERDKTASRMSSMLTNKKIIIESPIKRYIKEIDKKLKQKYLSKLTKKSLKSEIHNKTKQQHQHRLQRMKFMGIPIAAAAAPNQNQYENLMSTNKVNDDELTLKDKQQSAVPESVKIIPKIPSVCCSIDDDKCDKSKVIPMIFEKAQPRGNNPEMLRTDKSLPWIQFDTLNSVHLKDIPIGNREVNWNHVSIDSIAMNVDDNKAIANQSDMKTSFNNLIASKLKNYRNLCENELYNDEIAVVDDDDDAIDVDYKMKVVQSESTLSSTGTNFTNDSGSYVVILDEKIPKSRINIGKKFQNRSLVTTKIQPSLENQPYFIGDLNTLKQLIKPPDRFHTQRTRSCANIRERVQVNTLDYENELFGTEKSQLATDIDESYVKEFYHERTNTEFRFKRITETERLRQGFRKKIETFYIKEQLLLNQIQSEKDTKTIEEVTNTVNQYDTFLNDFKEMTHRNTMRIMQDVKNYYHNTSILQAQYDHLQSQVEPMKMKVFYLGNDFSRLTRYQHFQYLLMPMEWRLRHDHLHRTENDNGGALEDTINSLMNRDNKNIWDRQNVTVDAIMSYINDVYCKREYEMEVPFRCGEEMIGSIDVLKSKSLKILSKYTYASMKFLMLKNEHENLQQLHKTLLIQSEFTARSIRSRCKFFESRCADFHARSKAILEKPLEESFRAELLHQLNSYCRVLFKATISDGSDSNSTLEQFKLIEQKVLGMLTTIDAIPKELFSEMEKLVRSRRKRQLRRAEHAYKIEINIDMMEKQLRRLYAKPAERMKKSGKLERFLLPKKQFKVIEPTPVLGPLEEKYFQAFMDLDNDKNARDARFDPNVRLMIEKIKNESTPFYVDRFIESLGISMKKLSPQDVENIIKDEETRLKFKDVLPSVRMKAKYLDFEQQIQKENDIKKTIYLYQKK